MPAGYRQNGIIHPPNGHISKLLSIIIVVFFLHQALLFVALFTLFFFVCCCLCIIISLCYAVKICILSYFWGHVFIHMIIGYNHIHKWQKKVAIFLTTTPIDIITFKLKCAHKLCCCLGFVGRVCFGFGQLGMDTLLEV